MTEPEKTQDATPVASDIERAAMSTSQVAIVEKITAANLEIILKNAEALVEFHNKIQKICLKVTKPHNWTMLGDKPYLMDAGISNVLKIIGVSITGIRVETEAKTGQDGRLDFYYTSYGKMHFNGQVYENVGVSSTKDKFFAERTRKADEPDKWKKGDKYLLTVDEIELPNVQKKSVTNLKHRLLMTAFNLSPDADELKEHFGEEAFKKIGKVSYGKGSGGGSSDTDDEKKSRVELGNIVKRIADNESKRPEDVLKELTAFKDFAGKDDLRRVSANSLKINIKKAKDMAKKLGIEV